MSAINRMDICNLDFFYANKSNYPINRKLLENLLEGKREDCKEGYADLEKSNLRSDINEIYYTICQKVQKKVFPKITISAGAAGAGKTRLVHQLLQNEGSEAVHISVDDVCLQRLSLTYQAEFAKLPSEVSNDDKKTLRKELYEKWSPGLQAAAHVILGSLIKEQYDIFLGTRALHSFMSRFFEFFKKMGYTIQVLYVNAPNEVRWKSIQERDKAFVQITREEVYAQGNSVPQRINDTYLKFADTIRFFYRDDVNESAVLAAKWTQNAVFQPSLVIYDVDVYEKIKAIHNLVCEQLHRADILWEKVIE